MTASYAPIPPFDSIFDSVLQVSDPGSTATTGLMNFTLLEDFFNGSPIYQYNGSLTTPPCTEGVSWYVSVEAIPLDAKRYNNLKRVLKYNARYAQNYPGKENLLGIVAAGKRPES